MSDATAVLDRPRKRPGRPATGERGNVVEVTFDDDELAILDALLAQRGKKRGRATLLREQMLREAQASGITGAGHIDGSEVTAA